MERKRSILGRKTAVTSYLAYMIYPLKTPTGFSHHPSSFSQWYIFFFRIFVKFKRQIINTNIIQMRKKNYFITIANRLWYVGIWMRFSEKWSEYHDEKHSWYRSWWIYLLALWLWHVIWTRSFYESVYRNRRLFTRLNIFWTLFPTLFSHTFPRIFTFSKYLNDKILRFHF